MDKKWNLQDIKPAGSSRQRRVQPRTEEADESAEPATTLKVRAHEEAEYDDTDTEKILIADGNRKRRGGIVVIGFIILGIFALAILASYLLRGAEVIVKPHTYEPNVNATFTAYAEAPAGELAYEVMTLEASGERQVAASGQQEVSEQATGRVTIYKSTPGTQRLIKNTRLEDASGKIVRISESVVVPGSVDGNPGSIFAEVFADEAGEAYNLPAGTRFTVPGLESDPSLFNAIYAENENALSGGFVGQRFIIDDEQLATAKQALQMELRDALLQRLPNERPANVTSFENSVAFTYESLPAVAYGDDLATIKERALLHIPLFKSPEFASYLAAATIPQYDGDPMRVEDPALLTFSYASATTSNTNLANLEQIEFTLSGRPTLVATYDEGKLVTDLLGTPKNTLNTVLSRYPAIKSAEVVIKPFWRRSFPTDLNEITVTEVIERPQ